MVLALAISASVLLGFIFTYIGPIQMMGPRSALPLSVHIHGVSFLIWYGLLAVQSALVVGRWMRLHRVLGAISIALVVMMTLSALLVIGVKMDLGLKGESPFWAAASLGVLSNLVLFVIFYTGALVRRNRPDWHRRLIISAAAAGSGAAVFRIYAAIFGMTMWTVPVGILTTNVFILAGMVFDKVVERRVHPAYFWTLPLAVSLETLTLFLASTPVGHAINTAIVFVLRPFFGFY